MRATSLIGELLTRGTIWITLLAYLVGGIILHFNSGRPNNSSLTRTIWTIGCFSLALHFVTAFNFYHDWSQVSAYEETARQTDEYVGLNWGGGLYINYAILSIWLIDLAAWWRQGADSYRRQFWKLRVVWHSLLIFIIINALIVFKGGIVRWLGVVYCLILLVTWLPLRIFSASPR